MAEQDRKATRGADWFIDFEQGALDAEAVPRQGRHRPGRTGPARPKQDVQPKFTGPSPWVADFLLNQVDGARIEPCPVRRNPVRAEGEEVSQRSQPAIRGMPNSGAAEAGGRAATAGGVANGLAEAPEPMARAAPPPPATVKSRIGGYRALPYALTTALVLALAAGLFALPKGSWRNTPDEGNTRSAWAAPETRLPAHPPKPDASWRELPVEAAAVLQPVGTMRTQASPSAATVEDGEPPALASLAGAPAATSLAQDPEVIEASSPPVRTARILFRPPQPLAALVAAAEVTARDADSDSAVAGPSPDQDRREDVRTSAWGRPPSRTPAKAPPSSEATSPSSEGTKGTPEVRPARVARQHERLRHVTRPRLAHAAQASQGRVLTLPAALRPTSF